MVKVQFLLFVLLWVNQVSFTSLSGSDAENTQPKLILWDWKLADKLRNLVYHNNFDALQDIITPENVNYVIEHIDGYGSPLFEKAPLLHQAVYYKRLNMIEYLLKSGADIEAKNKYGTALHVAVKIGDVSIVKYLVEHGATINAIDKKGFTPLFWAVCHDFFDIVEYLLQQNCHEGPLDLFYYAKSIKVAQMLIMNGYGADCNVQDDKGYTNLYWQSYNGKIDFVKFLVENGADINKKNVYGLKPIHVAIFNNQLEVVKYLIDQGADVNEKIMPMINNIETISYDYSDASVLIYLFESENIFKNNDEYRRPTALHLACMAGKLYCVKLLIKNGCDINTQDHNGHTPLNLVNVEKNKNYDNLKDRISYENIADYLKSKGAKRASEL